MGVSNKIDKNKILIVKFYIYMINKQHTLEYDCKMINFDKITCIDRYIIMNQCDETNNIQTKQSK